jgi:hypothetical protein
LKTNLEKPAAHIENEERLNNFYLESNERNPTEEIICLDSGTGQHQKPVLGSPP